MGVDFVDHERVDIQVLLHAGNDYQRVHGFFGIASSENIILNVFVRAMRCRLSRDFLICVLWSTGLLCRHLLEGYVPAAVADQSGGQQQAAPAADGGQQQAAPAAGGGQQQAAPAAADDQQQAAAQPQAPVLDDRLQAWVDGGKQAGNITSRTATTAIGTSRMGQRAGKPVFNSQEALEFGKQVAAALGNTAATVPLRQIIQDTEDVGIANQPVNEEMHQQLMRQMEALELEFEPKGETLNEQLQKISERWGFGK